MGQLVHCKNFAFLMYYYFSMNMFREMIKCSTTIFEMIKKNYLFFSVKKDFYIKILRRHYK